MASSKKFNFKFNSDEVVNSAVHKSKNGYNYAQVQIKRGDNQYISLGYEWQGDSVPDLAMDLLGFMGMNQEAASISDETKAEVAEFAKRFKEICL